MPNTFDPPRLGGSPTQPGIGPTAAASAPYAGVRAVVLGAGGFVGRWVARCLSSAGADLHLVDRRADVLDTLRDPYGVRGSVHALDVRDVDALMRLLAELRPHVAFNLVGYGVDPRERDQVAAEQLNAAFPPRLCEVMARVRDPSWPGLAVMHVGTALEYGRAAGNLDEAGPVLPTTLYGQTKLAGVRALEERARDTGTPAVTARLFTVYGPGEHPGRLLPSLYAAARTSERLPLTAGHQRRDFTFVGDVAEGLLRLAARAGAADPIVNLATGTLMSVRGFVEAAARILRIGSERLGFGALPTRPEEMEHEAVTVARLRRLVGWVPQVSVEEGVRRTVEFLNVHDSLATS